MSKISEQITTPVGRIVQGDAWKLNPQTIYGKTDPKLDKQGQQIHERFIGLAIRKDDPSWPAFWATLCDIASRGHNGAVPTGFSYKIKDGDAPEHVAREGFAGCFVLSTSTQFETKIYDASGDQILDPSLCKRGDWADMLIDVSCDGHITNPSLYISPKIVRRIAFGEEIVGGPDVSAMGAAPAAPPGTSQTPVAPRAPAAAPQPPAAPMAPPVAPQAPVAPPVAPVAPPVAPVMAPAPNVAPSVATGPGPAAPPVAPLSPPPVAPVATISPGSPLVPNVAPAPVPAAPVAPTASPSNVMTSKAEGQTYEMWIAGGWTDQQLIAEGYMIESYPGFAQGPAA